MMKARLAGATLVAALVFAGSASAGSAADPVAEVVAHYKAVEQMFNSDAFRKDRRIMFEDFDPSEQYRLFDINQPTERRGAAARQHMYEISGVISGKVEFLNLEVKASDTVAFASYIQHVVGKDPAGNPIDLSVRTTDGLAKVNGRWLIMHEHNSLALDDATLGAMLAKKK